MDAIPEGTVLEQLDATWGREIALPAHLTVKSNAYVGRCIVELPEGMKVGGDLAFSPRWGTPALS